MASLIKFEWSRPDEGFEWFRGLGYEGQKNYLGETLYAPTDAAFETEYLIPRKNSFKRYNPFERPGLFREFAEIDQSNRRSILNFANQYGLLGIGWRVDVNGIDRLGEHSGMWGSQIYAMRDAVTTWDAIKESDAGLLASRIKWTAGDSGNAVMFHGENSVFQIAPKDRDAGLILDLAVGDVTQPAVVAVSQIINRKLREHFVRPQLHVQVHGQRQESSVLFTPTTLIAALWIQLAYAVERDKKYSQCRECKDWIESGARDTSRADKLFCSPTCKARAHKKKVQQAKELYVGGRKLADIARELETTVPKVKGWIK